MTEILTKKDFDGKKCYQSPALRVYGDILKVTQSVASKNANADVAKGSNKTH
jgi:hypothetical protein